MFSRVAIGEVALTEPTPEIAVTRGDDPGIEKSTAVDGNEKVSVRRGLGQREIAEETVIRKSQGGNTDGLGDIAEAGKRPQVLDTIGPGNETGSFDLNSPEERELTGKSRKSRKPDLVKYSANNDDTKLISESKPQAIHKASTKSMVAFSPEEVARNEQGLNPPIVKSALEALVVKYTMARQPKQAPSTGISPRYGPKSNVRGNSGKLMVDKTQSLAHITVDEHVKNLSTDHASQSTMQGSVRWAIYPDGGFRLAWDVTGLLFIIYQGFIVKHNFRLRVYFLSSSKVPFTLSFETELLGLLADFDRCIDLYFISDIALNFVTGYWNRGALIRSVTLLNPFDVKWRLARLLRLLRLNVLLMKLEEHIDSDVWLATFILIKMFLGLFVLSHWLACVWWSIGVAHEDSETNWIRDNQLDEEGHFATKYLRSLFYAISIVSTMYGDVIAANDGERIFTMFAMLAAGVVFAVVVGSVTNLVVSFGEYKTEYRQRMKRAMRFMRAHNVEPDLQVKIRRYIEHLLDNQFEFKSKSELMTMLSESLQGEVQLNLMGKLLKKYNLFTSLREELVGRICMVCKPVFCAPGDVVFYQGDNADGMYFVRKGALTVIALILPDPPMEHDSTGVCNSFTELMYIKRDDLREKIIAAADGLTLYLEMKAVVCLERERFEDCRLCMMGAIICYGDRRRKFSEGRSIEIDDEELLSRAQELRNIFAVALCKHGRLYEEDDVEEVMEGPVPQPNSPKLLKRGASIRLTQLTEKWMPVKCLTTHGAQLCVADSMGRTPFDLTTDKEMLSLLQAMDLHTATRNNDVISCRAAIEAGIDLNWVHPKTGTTALYGAVDKMHEEMVTLLLDGKADPNTAPSTGFSPLYAAANRGVPRISKILLEYNGDPNRRIGNGETPLFAALRKTKARDEMVELLLKAGANVNVYSNQQVNPFRVALEKNCDKKVLDLLLKYGAVPDGPNLETGDTILQQTRYDLSTAMWRWKKTLIGRTDRTINTWVNRLWTDRVEGSEDADMITDEVEESVGRWSTLLGMTTEVSNVSKRVLALLEGEAPETIQTIRANLEPLLQLSEDNNVTITEEKNTQVEITTSVRFYRIS
ncbi:voltage and ligand gated potassium channel, putative [Perkinsus marinus ATCC 50983]|uniref:Voltage and ligand gated potassium channel, putative n=2 Tax=Perkinsus marinus (strain ATCC 50983 / TXsc) TaxID=423536 RepID=C5KU08_PERM5|nr:voltage and ligand gated potassium channel, putative [Perkinsus marinus ATCC 50983]EER12050.1 voltage and ligand gated potassium channel, putative [Perkinsus marinus ATCC 50983]|eukprot:XP_002780255.1 voltage and ligand gated potassium channel, putative [Perkinsus marinus ATCC 50983]